MSSDGEDELARTATAPAGGAASAPARSPEPIGPTLGRYKLERELGSGGMGVVHAAFDPDLERRVALKVLLNVEGSREARQRLLREARAMARLAHPNVVTVHEVGSAAGRDYVAMELIDGQTLAEWVRAAPRAERDVVDAFVAAGRGLAAAHAAGIVHRDFKPHNVLISRSGRIVVTDFGLAREAESPAGDPMTRTRELRVRAGAPASGASSTPLSGLTVTGSVLGTPAYMAPEQWRGRAVTPATDQFAFCVALWEALAGARPFDGATLEALRDAVEAGPGKLDAAKIPRRLRPALRRGLDPDPARRWPSMDALLAAIARARRRGVAVRVGAAAVAVAALAGGAVISQRGGAPTPAGPPPCRPSAVAVDDVWPATAHDRLAKLGQRGAADQLAADASAWRAARGRACDGDVALREPRLACLDGVLARLDAVARGVERLGAARPVDPGGFLVDPVVCTAATPPRLAPTATPQLRAVVAGLLAEQATPGRPSATRAKALVDAAAGGPCASAYARQLAIAAAPPAEREQLTARANEDAERCTDDRVRAELAIMNAQRALESALLGTSITGKLKLAEVAAQRVMQADLQAALDAMRAEIARRADQLDEAIARAAAAVERYAARGRVAAELDQALALIELRQTRATLADLAAVRPALDAARARGVARLGADHPTVHALELAIARWQFATGDAAGAVARAEALYRAEPNVPGRAIEGKVVDARGAPVAGARVAAGKRLGGTTASIASFPSASDRFATTGADGRFAIPDAAEFGSVVAQLGDRRSRPVAIADRVALALEPTATIRGRIDLRGEPPTTVIAVAVDPDAPAIRYGWVSPVARDGSYEIAGVPRKRLRVFASTQDATGRTGRAVTIRVDRPVVEGVALALPASHRVVHVIVRSAVGMPVINAAVLVGPGKIPSMSARELRQSMTQMNEHAARQIEGEHAPAPVVSRAQPGDLFATMTGVPEGPASACAIALPADLADPKLNKKIDDNLDKLRLECRPIAATDQVVVIEVPPFPRLD